MLFVRSSWIIIFFISIICFDLNAVNDSVKNQIGINLGGNFTICRIKSEYMVNFPGYKPGLGFFVGGFYNTRCSEKILFEMKLLFEQRNIIDKRMLLYTDVNGNTIGALSNIKQTNSCIIFTPLFFYKINKFLSIGMGTSLNYLMQSHQSTKYFDKTFNNYYRYFQPEGNAVFKITIKNTILFWEYAISFMDKIKGEVNTVKEYDNVFRFGIGYLLKQ